MSIRWPRWGNPTIVLLALASSIVGIVNWFTYDDRYIIELNPAAHNLHAWWRAFQSSYWPKDWGGDGYRPLTILAFKIEGAIGGGIPVVYHAANILLYAGVSLLVFALARRLLPLWAAWVVAALFAVHPVHVEAVANVVGQSELLTAVAVLVAVILYLRDRQAGPLRVSTALAIAGLYAVACFAKEHGIVLPALLGAAELTVIGDSTPLAERVRRLRPFYLVLVLVAVSFIWVRSIVLADHGIGGFVPFTPFGTLHSTGRDRVLTALGVVPEWVRLLLWPAHLASEYGPPGIEIAQGYSLSQLPGLVLLIAVLSLGVGLRRRQPVISFGIAFVCVTLLPVSNFILPAGIVLAERTLFLPSVGAMLMLGGAAVWITELVRMRYRDEQRLVYAARALLMIVLVAGTIRSAVRTRVWRDNETLFHQAVIDSPLSYRAHFMLGAWNFERKRKRDGEMEYRKALNLFPYDPALSYNMADQYRAAGMCGPAIPLYRWTRGLAPNFPLGHSAFAWCLLYEGNYAEAKLMALDAMRFGADLKAMRRIIFLADSVKASDAHVKPGALGSVTGDASKMRDSSQKTVGQPTIRPSR